MTRPPPQPEAETLPPVARAVEFLTVGQGAYVVDHDGLSVVLAAGPVPSRRSSIWSSALIPNFCRKRRAASIFAALATHAWPEPGSSLAARTAGETVRRKGP